MSPDSASRLAGTLAPPCVVASAGPILRGGASVPASRPVHRGSLTPVLTSLLLALLLPLFASAQDSFRSLRSQSGQFIVRGLSVSPSLVSQSSPADSEFVRLDPAVLAVGCEHIKQALLEELALADHWQGAIQLNLHPYRQDNESIQLGSVRFKNGWAYYVEIPELVERTRLIRAVVQSLLSELANRKGSDRAVELPWWLLEGLPGYLYANGPDIFTLELAAPVVKRHGREESLKAARELLRSRPALTLDELSWPSDDLLAEPNLRIYQECAHVFVHQLLHLKNGHKSMGAMVSHLADNLNWQTTFLQAFKEHFPRLIDLDKWWALSAAQLVARDPMSIWPVAETLSQLNSILLTPIEVRSSPDELPTHSQLNLQRILSEWDRPSQQSALNQKLTKLQALRLRAAPETLRLIDGYMIVLQQYLATPENVATAPRDTEQASIAAKRKSEILRRLNELDSTGERLRASRGR